LSVSGDRFRLAQCALLFAHALSSQIALTYLRSIPPTKEVRIPNGMRFIPALLFAASC
jgi:hypothetical protein